MSAMSERVSSGAAGKQLGVSGGDLRRAGYTNVTTALLEAWEVHDPDGLTVQAFQFRVGLHSATHYDSPRAERIGPRAWIVTARRELVTRVSVVAYAAAGTGGGPLSCWLAALAAFAALAKQT
jgi:hypothetical protein